MYKNCTLLWFLLLGLFLIPYFDFWFRAIGSSVIVVGLYSVLWGKSKEMNENDHAIQEIVTEVIKDKDNEKDEMNDLELQSYIPSNGN